MANIILKRSFVPVLVLIAAALVAFEWRSMAGGHADVAQVPAKPSKAQTIRAEGRLVTYPGAQAIIGTDVGGTLTQLLVAEKGAVKRGQVIAEIDSRVERAALAEARTRVEETDVSVGLASREVERMQRLHKDQAVSMQLLDRAQTELDAARAKKNAASASAARLSASLGKLKIASPIDGVVISRHADSGETLAPGAPIVTVANLARTRVEAEVDEYDIGGITVGAEARITAEGFSGKTWRGRVEEIPDAVVSRRIKPQDPGRPSDTRVLLVKISLAEPTPLKLGQRVELSMDAGPSR